MGLTGVGKSTLIRFLAGSKITRGLFPTEEMKFLPHLFHDDSALDPELKMQLEGLDTSPQAQSITKFIKVITIDHRNGQIILVDTPGSGDLRGHEVDVCNSISV